VISLSPVSVFPWINETECMKVFAHLWCSTHPGCAQAFRFQSVAFRHNAEIWKQALDRKKEPNSGVGWRDRKRERKSRGITDKSPATYCSVCDYLDFMLFSIRRAENMCIHGNSGCYRIYIFKDLL